MKIYTQCQAKGKTDTECSIYNIGRWCERHRDHFRRGIIDKNGNKLRDIQERYDQCQAKGKTGTGPCTKYHGGRWCRRHQGHWNHHHIDWEGKVIKPVQEHAGSIEKYHGCLAAGKPGTGRCGGEKHGKFCARHRVHFLSGIIDEKGNKLRDLLKWPGKYKHCQAKGKPGNGECTGYQSGRYCNRHANQFRLGIIDGNGDKLRDLKYQKGTGCAAANKGNGHCSTYYGGKWCGRHIGHYKLGLVDKEGNNLRPFKKHGCEKQYHNCIINNSECTTYNGGKYCSKHKSQLKRGIINENGKVLRALKKGGNEQKFFECIAKDAGTGTCSKFGGFGKWCTRHRGQYELGILNKNGKAIRKFFNGNPEFREKCHIPGCKRLAGYKRKWCRFHYEDIWVNENFERYPSIIPKFDCALKEEATTWDE